MRKLGVQTTRAAGFLSLKGRSLGAERWTEQLGLWRAEVLNRLGEFSQDTVVVSHFVAINVAVGHILKDDRVTCFRPDHCSCTVLDVVDGRLSLVELGAQGATRVL